MINTEPGNENTAIYLKSVVQYSKLNEKRLGKRKKD